MRQDPKSRRGGPRPGAGRPPRVASPGRESHTIQFTPAEWAAIKGAATRAGTTPGRWLREVGVRAAMDLNPEKCR